MLVCIGGRVVGHERPIRSKESLVRDSREWQWLAINKDGVGLLFQLFRPFDWIQSIKVRRCGVMG